MQDWDCSSAWQALLQGPTRGNLGCSIGNQDYLQSTDLDQIQPRSALLQGQLNILPSEKVAGIDAADISQVTTLRLLHYPSQLT